MSLSLLWEPTEPHGQRVPGTGLDSHVLKVLHETFDSGASSPSNRVELKTSHAFALRAMAAATGDTMYSEMATLVDTHGSIEVWGEH